MNTTPPADVASGLATDWRALKNLDLPPILAAALKSFTEKGYHATSVREIARAVGVTVPAIYYHFENKQALLVALLQRAVAAVMEKVHGALAEATEDPASRLAAVVQGIAYYEAHHSDIAFLDGESRALTAENRAWYITARDGIEAPLRDSVDRGVANGTFKTREPDECVRAILAMCQGISAWYRLGGPITPAELAERYSRIALAVVESE